VRTRLLRTDRDQPVSNRIPADEDDRDRRGRIFRRQCRRGASGPWQAATKLRLQRERIGRTNGRRADNEPSYRAAGRIPQGELFVNCLAADADHISEIVLRHRDGDIGLFRSAIMLREDQQPLC